MADLIVRDFHHELRVIPKNDLHTEIGSAIYFGGMVDGTSAGLNPARYVAGLAQTIPGDGSHVFENSRVVEWEPRRVASKQGKVQARHVMMATRNDRREPVPMDPSGCGHCTMNSGWKSNAKARAFDPAAKRWSELHHPGRCPVVSDAE